MERKSSLADAKATILASKILAKQILAKQNLY